MTLTIKLKRPSPASSMSPSAPATPTPSDSIQEAEQSEQPIANGASVEMQSSPPPPKKKQLKAKKPPSMQDDKAAAAQLPSPESSGSQFSPKEASAEQEQFVQPKKPVSRKRKAEETSGNDAAPATKRKRPLKPKVSPETVVDSDDEEEEEEEEEEARPVLNSSPSTHTHPPLPLATDATEGKRAASKPKQKRGLHLGPRKYQAHPSPESHARLPRSTAPQFTPTPPRSQLSDAIKHKINNVNMFLTAHPEFLHRTRGNGNNIHLVRERDVHAALMILCVDYQLGIPPENISPAAAKELIVKRYDGGVLHVDFDRSCGVERAVQDKVKLEYGAGGFWAMNLVQVEMQMLLERQKKAVEDGVPTAAFRMYGDQGERLNT